MRKYSIVFFLLLINLIFPSCELFKTRTPEEPSESNLNYQPSTTPQILLENFIKSFNQKNLAIFQSCFESEPYTYKFIPSSDALSLYHYIFLNWTINSEINFARNLFNKFSSQDFPNLVFSNSSFQNYSTDSTVYVADYELSINSKDNSINNIYKGTSQLVLVLDKTGLWKIIRWYDFSKQIDNFQTISFLKAKLSS